MLFSPACSVQSGVKVHATKPFPLANVANDCDETSDVFCSSFECSDGYSLVDDADKTECKDTGCTKKLCCEKDGETSTTSISRLAGQQCTRVYSQEYVVTHQVVSLNYWEDYTTNDNGRGCIIARAAYISNVECSRRFREIGADIRCICSDRPCRPISDTVYCLFVSSCFISGIFSFVAPFVCVFFIDCKHVWYFL